MSNPCLQSSSSQTLLEGISKGQYIVQIPKGKDSGHELVPGSALHHDGCMQIVQYPEPCPFVLLTTLVFSFGNRYSASAGNEKLTYFGSNNIYY